MKKTVTVLLFLCLLLCSCEQKPKDSGHPVTTYYSIEEFQQGILETKRKAILGEKIYEDEETMLRINAIVYPQNPPQGFVLESVFVKRREYFFQFVPTEDYEEFGKYGHYHNTISYCFRELFGFTASNGYTLFESAVKSAKENGIDLTADGALYEEYRSRRTLTIGYQDDSTISVTTHLDLTYEELLAISRPMEIPVN